MLYKHEKPKCHAHHISGMIDIMVGLLTSRLWKIKNISHGKLFLPKNISINRYLMLIIRSQNDKILCFGFLIDGSGIPVPHFSSIRVGLKMLALTCQSSHSVVEVAQLPVNPF